MTTQTLEQLGQLTYWQLAEMASCGNPDNENSPGASMLLLLRDEVLAAIDNDELTESTLMELADGVVSVYTYARWLQFVDLCAWDEDVTDYNMAELTDLAGAALVQIGERLVYALAAAAGVEVR